MTKKDYELIARAIRIQANALFITPHIDERSKNIISTTLKNIMCGMARELKRENSRFDEDKFYKACDIIIN